MTSHVGWRGAFLRVLPWRPVLVTLDVGPTPSRLLGGEWMTGVCIVSSPSCVFEKRPKPGIDGCSFPCFLCEVLMACSV